MTMANGIMLILVVGLSAVEQLSKRLLKSDPISILEKARL